MGKKLRPIDGNGKRLSKGDEVRIAGVPDLSKMSVKSRGDLVPIFQHLVGKYKKISSFGKYGHAEIWFRIKEKDGWHRHMVSLEPFLLRKRRPRSLS
jgi:hypothetical protein